MSAAKRAKFGSQAGVGGVPANGASLLGSSFFNEGPPPNPEGPFMLMLFASIAQHAVATLDGDVGSGNYVRLPGDTDLVRTNLPSSQSAWSKSFRMDHLSVRTVENSLGCTPDTFDKLVEVVEPWMSVPRRFSEGFWYSGWCQEETVSLFDVCGGKQFSGFKYYTQSVPDRLYHFLSWLSSSASANTQGPDACYSGETLCLDRRHISWAVRNALKPYTAWPSSTARDALWNETPSLFKDFLSDVCGEDVDRIVCTQSGDGGVVPVGRFPPPPNLCDYHSYKYGVTEVMAHTSIVDLWGRFDYFISGGPGSTCDVKQLRSSSLVTHKEDFLRSRPTYDVTDKILLDGIYVNIGSGWDKHAVLPPRQPNGGALNEEESDQYLQHQYFRTVVENAPGAVKQKFKIIDHPPKMSYKAVAQIHGVCTDLYNFITLHEGTLAENRFDWLG